MNRLIGKFFIILLIIFIPIAAIGADALYRLMHNDHDALVIAEVKEISEKKIKLKVEKSIISKSDLNMMSKIKQLKIDEFEINLKDFNSISFYNNQQDLKEGDALLLSLDKKGNDVHIAWGTYRVSSLDYKTLDILYPEDSPQWVRMDAAAIKTFVNSNGKKTEYSFNGNTYTVKDKNGKIIYDGNYIDVEQDDSKNIEIEKEPQIVEVVSNNLIEENSQKDFIFKYIIPFLIIAVWSYWRFRRYKK